MSQLHVWEIAYEDRDPRLIDQVVPNAPFMVIDPKPFIKCMQALVECPRESYVMDKQVLQRIIANPCDLELSQVDCHVMLVILNRVCLSINAAMSGGFQEMKASEFDFITSMDCRTGDLMYYLYSMRGLMTYVATYFNCKIRSNSWDIEF